MASNFKYGSSGTDLLDLSAKCDSLMVGSYGTTLNANKYCPDTTNLVKYSTSILNGLWANKLAPYASYYKVGSSATAIGIAAKGCAPVPKRYNNGSHMSSWTINSSGRLYYFPAGHANANLGEGIYIIYDSASSYTFLKKATHVVVDIVGGGGGGSGGNTGWNISGNSRGGAGGGSGGWASYLVDMSKLGDYLYIQLGSGGAGGGVEKDGGNGTASMLSIAGQIPEGFIGPVQSTPIVTCNGGGGAIGSNYWDGCGAAGGGGSVSTSITLDATRGIKLLASGAGASGGKGASISSSHGAGNQGSHGPSSISFGGLVNFTNVSCTGGSAAKAASYDYSNLDDRCAIGGGGGGSMLAPGGHGGGSMKTYNTIYANAVAGTKGSGGGGGHGGYSGRGGAAGGAGVAVLYMET